MARMLRAQHHMRFCRRRYIPGRIQRRVNRGREANQLHRQERRNWTYYDDHVAHLYLPECPHSFWEECHWCDGGSLNTAALGTVDFNGTYTVGR